MELDFFPFPCIQITQAETINYELRSAELFHAVSDSFDVLQIYILIFTSKFVI